MAGPEVRDLASFLAGDWRLDREILDASRRRPTGHFSGTARFARDDHAPGLLRYLEHGTLRLGSYRGPACRRLFYDVDGATARVAFDDGRYFHDLDLREGVWEVEHPCGDDRYVGRFEVDDAHRWRQRWTVNGPRKQQLIRTVLQRPGVDPSAGRIADEPEVLAAGAAGWLP
jgi:hypothetical protein